MQHRSSGAPAASVSCDGPVPVVGSEGARAVFYQAGPDAIYLLTAYAKADREDLTPADTKALTRLVAAIKKELRESDDGTHRPRM
jgi:hypothetical protein